MAVLFIPIALNVLLGGNENLIYHWMTLDPAKDKALSAKFPLFTKGMFFVTAALCFALWSFFALRLRYWSLAAGQDRFGRMHL